MGKNAGGLKQTCVGLLSIKGKNGNPVESQVPVKGNLDGLFLPTAAADMSSVRSALHIGHGTSSNDSLPDSVLKHFVQI